MRYLLLVLTVGAALQSVAQRGFSARVLAGFQTSEEEAYFQGLGPAISDANAIKALLEVQGGDVKNAGQYHDRLVGFIRQNPIESNSSTVSLKSIRRIFEQAQDAFFVRYDEKALFKETLERGEFNCLTASTLLSLLFNGYGLLHEVHVKPGHVYLTMQSKEGAVSIETTNPISGVFLWNEKTLRDYTRQMLGAKLITQDQVDALGMAGALGTLVEADSIASLSRLIGSHYFNSGVIAADAGDERFAVRQLARSYLLFPAPWTFEALKQTLLLEAADLKLDDLRDVEMLAAAYGFIWDGSAPSTIAFDQYRILNKSLKENMDTAFANATLRLLLQHIADPAVSGEMVFMHHMESGILESRRNNHLLAFSHFLACLETKPTHIDAVSNAKRAFLDYLFKSRVPGAAQSVLDSIGSQHPKATELTTYKDCYLISYAYLAERAFNTDDLREGEIQLTRFEQRFTPASELPRGAIASAYLAGWRSWARARNSSKAKNCIDRGLQYSPDDEDLNRVRRYKEY